MKTLVVLIMTACFCLSAVAVDALDLGVPRLSDSPASLSLAPPIHFLTTGGMKVGSTNDFSLEPEVGVGYGKRLLGQSGAAGLVLHKVHARAGGKVNLPNSLYLSAAAKLPLYHYEGTDVLTSGPPPSLAVSRHDYDLFRQPGAGISWSGEIGFRLGFGADLAIFYDQDQLRTFSGSVQQSLSDERFGSRIIFHFH